MAAPKVNPFSTSASVPARRHAVVVPHDTNDLDPMARSLLILAVGDVAFHDSEGNTATYPIINVPFVVPVLAKRVLATDTTVAAGNIIALW